MVKTKGSTSGKEISTPQKSRATNKSKALQLQDDDDDANSDEKPEEVSANREDIMKLRELHEQMMLPASKRTKKRKGRSSLQIADIKTGVPRKEEKLDDSVLAALESINEAEHNTNRISSQADEVDMISDILISDSRNNRVDSRQTKSRKIGNIDVQVLNAEENLLSAFTLSKNVVQFAQSIRKSQNRKSFAAVRSERRIGPSRMFAGNR